MIKSVARLYKWSPFEILKLYLDNQIDGLLFWYADTVDYNDQIKSSTQNK